MLNWYLLGLEMNLEHVNKTRFWYLLGVFSKFPVEHLRHFYTGLPPGLHLFFSVNKMLSSQQPNGNKSMISVGDEFSPLGMPKAFTVLVKD